MRQNIFAFTPTSYGAGLVPYLSLNFEADGRATLTVRSGGAGESGTIEIPDNELDKLAASIQSRQLARRLAALERRLADVEQRTGGLVRFGDGGAVRFGVAAAVAPTAFCAPFHADIRPVFVAGPQPQPVPAAGATRVLCGVTGRDLGSAD